VGASPHPLPHNIEATTMILSKVTIKDVGHAKKKDAYPKKVCHMLKRHVRKKD